MSNINETSVPKYLWAKTVKDLDGNVCAFCGTGLTLEAHHIRPKSQFPELSTDLENGITLCHQCHYAAHKGNYNPVLHGGAMKPFAVDPGTLRDFIREYGETRIVLAISHDKMNVITAHADARGESLNIFINRAIEETVERDNAASDPAQP